MLTQLRGFLRPYRVQIMVFVVALLIAAAVTLSIGQGLRLMIDHGFVGQSLDNLTLAIFVVMAMAVVMAAATSVRFYMISWLGERVSADIRSAVFNHIIQLHPAFFETNRSGDIMSRLTADTTLLQSIIGSSLSIALRSAISSSGALIMLFVTNAALSLIVIFTLPLVLIPILYFGRKVRTLSRQSQDSVASVGSYAGEVIQHIKTVQSFTQEPLEKKAFSNEVERAFGVARKRIAQRSLLTVMVILAVFSALSAMLWFGGKDVIQGQMSVGGLGAFVFYATLMALGVASLSEVFGELQRAAGATERLMELLYAPSEIEIDAEEGIDASPLPAKLALQEVTFHYPSRPAANALERFSLSIPEGSIVALVGPSGAGKSTIFSLVQRFYQVQSGVILFGGRDIKSLDLRSLRQQIGVVDQQPALFTGDVMYNIRYGNPQASDQQVVAAAEAAHAAEFIHQLPQGYASNLGEQGVRLSGGQRQRIAIARALLKDPRILLLDEATSALDAESEQKVQMALDKLMKNRTTIIIAHRLATILHADQIVVMDEGRHIAAGSHESLLKSCPLYARLAALQFSAEAAKQDDLPSV
jgi:ATP-binding cassette subfamily B protein